MNPLLTLVVSGRRPRLDDAAFFALWLLGASPPAAGLLCTAPPPGAGLLSREHRGNAHQNSTEPERPFKKAQEPFAGVLD